MGDGNTNSINQKLIRAEIHVHTVLSPCADVEMIPPLIVQEAVERGISLIAITDHNSAANAEAVLKAARGTSLTVLPGMEVQTIEEVHTLCIFDSLDQVREWDKIVRKHLPATPNNPDYFGEQFIVDETGDFIRREEQMLLISANFSLDEASKIVHDLGGLFIPAHINRKAFGLLPVLGFVPPDSQIDALEISKHMSLSLASTTYPQISQYPLIQNGDVHFLDDFIGALWLSIEKPNISEIKLALENQEGRKFQILRDAEH